MAALISRPVRSYVLRQGRISNAQQRAYNTLLPQFGIPYSHRTLDLNQVFRREALHVLEIGFGMGETTAAIAAVHSEIDYLGIEVHTPGVGSLLNRIDTYGLSNVRVIHHDAVEVLRQMIAPASLNGIHIFFPDPWPKKRHHKRRLLQATFVSLLASRMQPGAYLHIATDWIEYAEQMLQALCGEPLLKNAVDGYAPRPAYRPLTKFEQRGLKLGHEVRDIIFERTSQFTR